LDSIYPAAQSLLEHRDCSFEESFRAAAKAAAEGSEATKEMKSVHGRAAYYGEKSIGILDGGSVVGKLIFEALSE
ncbi:MAG: dihydroxyacetone kinase subunit L, partial [Clostridium sp.]|nr:dihydroxyacetone kinase subunit L [Clostridium sp.]